MVLRRVPEKAFSEQWELKELADDLRRVLNLDLPVEEWGREEGIDEGHLRERVEQAADAMMAAKAANMGPELMRFIEKSLLIQILDAVWKEHLYALDHLRQGIGLRAYGQRDPLNEYKSEAFALFNAMLDELKERVTGMLARVELAPEPVRPPPPVQMMELHPQPMSAFAGEPEMALEGARWRRAWRHADGGAAADAVRCGGSERSRDLAEYVKECAVPVRVREEVQALPRAAGLRIRCPACGRARQVHRTSWRNSRRLGQPRAGGLQTPAAGRRVWEARHQVGDGGISGDHLGDRPQVHAPLPIAAPRVGGG